MFDFLDHKGPGDTAKELDAKYGTVTDPILRLDLDYPNVPKGLSNGGVVSWLKNRAREQNVAPKMYMIRHRLSSSGNTHVEMHLSGEYKPSEVIMLRSKMGDDYYRVMCDSRRALQDPIYLGGYLHDNKWIPGQKEDGKKGNVIASAMEWKEVVPSEDT